MRALILAAGEGTRLRQLKLDCPKPMVPIGGKPLLEHTVGWLRAYGVADIAINLHYRPEAVTGHFGDGGRFGVAITYSYEPQLLGTAGAAKKLQSFFDTTFVVVYGDVFTNLNLARLTSFHHSRGRGWPSDRGEDDSLPLSPSPPAYVTLSLYHVPNPSACGIVDLDGEGRVMRFVEKPPPEQVFGDLANAGVMVVEPGILDYIPPDTFYDFGHDLLPRLLADGVPISGLPIAEDEYLVDIGTPERYAWAQREWRSLQGVAF